MNKFIDVVSEKLFENNSLLEIEDVFKSFSIDTVYVVREVTKKEDFNKFNLPSSKEITYKKIFLLKNINDAVSKTKEIVIGHGGDVSNISKVLLSKQIKHLFNPFSEKLVFDEGSANIAKQNSKKIIININDYRNNLALRSKIIKQTPFVLEMCMKKKVDFVYCSYAKRIEDVVDPVIIINFLKTFNVPETLSKRILTEEI